MIATKDRTTLIDGAGDTNVIRDYLQTLQTETERTASKYDHEKLQEPIRQLSNEAADENRNVHGGVVALPNAVKSLIVDTSLTVA